METIMSHLNGTHHASLTLQSVVAGTKAYWSETLKHPNKKRVSRVWNIFIFDLWDN